MADTSVKTNELNKNYKFYSNKALYDTLTNSIIRGRFCHAYLFCGKKSLGKKTLAINVAMSILCISEKKPCLECHSCKKILSGNHPDLFIYEGKGGKASIHIDEIREIRQDAFIKPNESDYKIYILPNVQDMSIATANAFLKVLEEPPSHAVFILTANSKQAVPETILSRCISFEVFPMAIEEELEALNELLPDKSQEEILRCAELSEGNLGRAIDFLTDASYNEMIELSKAAALGLVKKSEYNLLCAFSKATTRAAMLELISELTTIIRNAILHKLKVKLSLDKDIAALGYGMTSSQLNTALDLLQDAVTGIESNVNLTLLAGNLTAKLLTAVVG